MCSLIDVVNSDLFKTNRNLHFMSFKRLNKCFSLSALKGNLLYDNVSVFTGGIADIKSSAVTLSSIL